MYCRYFHLGDTYSTRGTGVGCSADRRVQAWGPSLGGEDNLHDNDDDEEEEERNTYPSCFLKSPLSNSGKKTLQSKSAMTSVRLTSLLTPPLPKIRIDEQLFKHLQDTEWTVGTAHARDFNQRKKHQGSSSWAHSFTVPPMRLDGRSLCSVPTFMPSSQLTHRSPLVRKQATACLAK
ncbi:hypothetical protein EYF80_021810 [Liparis tanakae]|uniref:Uncharacterized protein n=1 Tax=Liparis tanakae TaxID=230148 RepID=A0A4Z2HQJ1_9TELE|nr:hypothetical protein EYF80_021810 [Liparis tanakae]